MGFYSTSHFKFHDTGESNILFEITALISWDAEYTQLPYHMAIIMFYYLHWASNNLGRSLAKRKLTLV